jgi:cytochrome c peroxidase
MLLKRLGKIQLPYIIVLGLFLPVLTHSCLNEAPNSVHKKRIPREPETIAVLAALPEQVPCPPDNPITPEKIALGRLLFFDPLLSGKKDLACATCHHPDFGYSDGLEISIGVNAHGLGSMRSFNANNPFPFVKRNAQTILNTAFNGISNQDAPNPANAPMFWDLRAKSLEKQALEPIKAMEEMRGNEYPEDKALETVKGRIQAIPAYRKLFEKAFGISDAVSVENMGRAIASYERSLVNSNSRFDQYMRGNATALSSFELEGLTVFLESGCAQCHKGPMFSDYQTHVMGVPDNNKHAYSDSGFSKSYGFRTPSLRNLAFTYPYTHSGKFASLQQVLEFYEDLSNKKIANPHINDKQIDSLTLNLKLDFKNISLVLAFLNTLNDKFDKTIPATLPSGLHPGGNIK